MSTRVNMPPGSRWREREWHVHRGRRACLLEQWSPLCAPDSDEKTKDWPAKHTPTYNSSSNIKLLQRHLKKIFFMNIETKASTDLLPHDIFLMIHILSDRPPKQIDIHIFCTGLNRRKEQDYHTACTRCKAFTNPDWKKKNIKGSALLN